MIINLLLWAYCLPLETPWTAECSYLETRGLIERPWIKPYDLGDLIGRLDSLLTGEQLFSRPERQLLSHFNVLLMKNPDFSTMISTAAGYSSQPSETYGWLDLRLGGRVAEHISFHEALQFRGSSIVDSILPPYPWKKHIKGLLNEASLRYESSGFRLTMGRQNIQTGPFRDQGLLMNADSQGYDGFFISIPRRYFEFFSLSVILSSREKRYLALHRLGARLGSIRIGFAESIVWAENIEPLYLTSFVPYYLAQWGMHRDDNIMWSFDLSCRVFKTSVQAELLIDDFQYDQPDGFEEFPNKLAFKTALEKTFNRSVLVNLSYTFVDKWVYTQRIEKNTYAKDGCPLGSTLGNDADQLTFTGNAFTSGGIIPELIVSYTRRGEGSIFVPYEEELGDPNPPFPSGVVEKTLLGRAGARWPVKGHYHLAFHAGWQSVQNENHLQGRSVSQPVFDLNISALF